MAKKAKKKPSSPSKQRKVLKLAPIDQVGSSNENEKNVKGEGKRLRKSSVSMKDIALEEESLIQTETQKQFAMLKLTEQRAKDYLVRVRSMEGENERLRKEMVEYNNVKEDIIEDMEKRIEKYQSYVDDLLQKHAEVEREKDALGSQLFVAMAEHEEERASFRKRLKQAQEEIAQKQEELDESAVLTVNNEDLRATIQKLEHTIYEVKKADEADLRERSYLKSVEEHGSLVPLILRIMSTLGEHPNIQIEACAALYPLVQMHESVSYLTKLQGVPTILDLMKTYINSSELHKHASRILWKLSYDSKGLDAMRIANTSQTLLAVLEKHDFKDHKQLYLCVSNILRALLPEDVVRTYAQAHANPTNQEYNTHCIPSERTKESDDSLIASSMARGVLRTHGMEPVDEILVFFACFDHFFEKSNEQALQALKAALQIAVLDPRSVMALKNENVHHLIARVFISESSDNDLRQTMLQTILAILRSPELPESCLIVRELFTKVKFEEVMQHIVTIYFPKNLDLHKKIQAIFEILGLKYPRELKKKLAYCLDEEEEKDIHVPVTTKLIQYHKETVIAPKLGLPTFE